MKEPWEVFNDELKLEWTRIIKREGELTPEGFQKALRIAGEAMADDLVVREKWRGEDATDLALTLVRALMEKRETEVQERLKHAYTDWQLSRKR